MAVKVASVPPGRWCCESSAILFMRANPSRAAVCATRRNSDASHASLTACQNVPRLKIAPDSPEWWFYEVIPRIPGRSAFACSRSALPLQALLFRRSRLNPVARPTSLRSLSLCPKRSKSGATSSCARNSRVPGRSG